MRLQLGDNWRQVMRRAHSVRWIGLAMLCEAAAVLLHVWGAFSRSFGAALTLQLLGVVFGGFALLARVTKQRSLP